MDKTPKFYKCPLCKRVWTHQSSMNFLWSNYRDDSFDDTGLPWEWKECFPSLWEPEDECGKNTDPV
jgi:hypothetical protein